MRWPGIEPGSTAYYCSIWKATMLTSIPPSLVPNSSKGHFKEAKLLSIKVQTQTFMKLLINELALGQSKLSNSAINIIVFLLYTPIAS